jgi:predicted transcriptional regulator
MDLTPSGQAIVVDLLIQGDDSPKNIARRTKFTREAITRKLKDLQDQEMVVNKGGGVYRLTESGAEAARGLLMGGFNPYTEN